MTKCVYDVEFRSYGQEEEQLSLEQRRTVNTFISDSSCALSASSAFTVQEPLCPSVNSHWPNVISSNFRELFHACCQLVIGFHCQAYVKNSPSVSGSDITCATIVL